MKTLKIQSESKKGLFTDKQSSNDLSTEVKKLFDSGEKKVKLVEVVNNSNNEVILTGYIPRGATSKDSPFTYKSSDGKKLLCGDIRKKLGLPVYTRPRQKQDETQLVETFKTAANLHLASLTELEDLKERVLEELKRREEEAKKAELKKAVLARLTEEERAALNL